MMLRLALFGLFFCYFAVSARIYHVPVLIWGSGYENSKDNRFSSLARVGSDQFFDHFLKNIHKVNGKTTIVLFVEETLSVEDFSVQDVKGDGTFPLLKRLISSNDRPMEFLQSVENPVVALTGPQIKSYGFSVSDFNKDISTTSDNEGNKIFVVNLEDADSKEDRPHMLHRHDEKIQNIFNEFSQNNEHIVAILTGRFSSWTEPEEIIRVRREANESGVNDSVLTPSSAPSAKATNGIIFQTKTALIYTKSPPVLRIGDQHISLENSTVGLHDDREKWQRAVFSYFTQIGKVTLRFRFENTSNNYWSLSQIELEEPQKPGVILLSTKRQISAPYDYSFHTSTPLVFSNGTNSLTFGDMQVQPWKSLVELKKFGSAVDDTMFFTPPIWTGLIVTALITLILVWGLSMILDIRTMDQFDDPKGKTITVNVAE